MKARISFAIVVVALLTLSLLIPYTAAQETTVDPVAAELRAAEAFRHNPPLPAGEVSPAGRQAGAPDDVLYFWDFEGNNGGFAGTVDWVWGTYAWNGATCDPYTNYPPPGAHSGTDMWGTRLNTCYQNLGNNSGYNTCVNGNPTDDSILSFTVDLTGVTDPVEMSWWEWFDLFLNWDWSEVYVNGNVVFQHCGGSLVPPTAWVQQVVDLTPYIGGVATVEFHMMASTVVNHAGWFIDDVMVYTVAAAPDIEVTAPPLAAALCPGETATLEFTICNVGGGTLDWALSEAPPVKLNGSIATPAAAAKPRQVELKLEGMDGPSVQTHPTVPDLPVQLALDDGSAENYIGLNDGTYGFQFLWLNRFTPNPADFPFNLNQISVIPGATGVAVGDSIDLVVYQDTDGDSDPSNAAWLATYNVTVQYNDGATWNDYVLATPLALTGPGDVLIGVINRYQVSGVDPSDFPAALDQTATQQRSWVAAWSLDPPVPPVLPPDAGGLWGLIDVWFPGNWMVRGYGETNEYDIPWLTEIPTTGLVLAGECMTVEVTFDSDSMASGDYYGSLLISSNDPDEPQITLPVTMTVLPCASLEGHVTDMETGGVDPTCTAATVHVEPGGQDIPVDLDGSYGAMLDGGTYTLTASASGYSVETAVVTVTVGMTTTQDFSLQRAVIDVNPLGFDVNLPAGQTTTLPLTLANLGHLPLDWNILELPAPALMADLPWVAVDPISGTVPPQDSIEIDVTFTCTDTGDYTGTLYLTHNDPCADAFEIRLALHCTPIYYIYLPIALKNP